MPNIWTPRERRILDRLDTPPKLQRFVEELPYDPDGGFKSPRISLRDHQAQCYSGALLAAAALRYHGDPPLLVDLSVENDDEHVIAVFKKRDHWGAVSKSNYSTLGYREPMYRTIKELVLSYFEGYFNKKGDKTLRGFTRPLNLEKFDDLNWMVSEEYVQEIEDVLTSMHHYPLLTKAMKRSLAKTSPRLLKAGLLGSNPKGLFKA